MSHEPNDKEDSERSQVYIPLESTSEALSHGQSPGFYEQTTNLLNNIAKSRGLSKLLHGNDETLIKQLSELSAEAGSNNLVHRLAGAWERRQRLLELLSCLNYQSNEDVQHALKSDDSITIEALRDILSSRKDDVMALQGGLAVGMLNLLVAVLSGRSQSPSPFASPITSAIDFDTLRRLYRLSVRLCEASSEFPSLLYLKGLRLDSERFLGGGSNGDIFRGTYHGSRVAMKCLRRIHRADSNRSTAKEKAWTREIALLIGLHHPNICSIIGVDREIFSDDHTCLVMPWMEQGNLWKYIQKEGCKENEARDFISQILHGLSYLHSMNVAHGDLYLGNVLLDELKQIRLVDFGLSNFTDTTDVSCPESVMPGAPRYMAPEILRPEAFKLSRVRHTSASDMYSFGLVCWQIYTGEIPFQEYNQYSVIFQIVEGKHPTRLSSKTRVPDDLWTILEACWKFRPEGRPTSHELRLSHMWDPASSQILATTSEYELTILTPRPTVHQLDNDTPCKSASNFPGGEYVSLPEGPPDSCASTFLSCNTLRLPAKIFTSLPTIPLGPIFSGRCIPCVLHTITKVISGWPLFSRILRIIFRYLPVSLIQWTVYGTSMVISILGIPWRRMKCATKDLEQVFHPQHAERSLVPHESAQSFATLAELKK